MAKEITKNDVLKIIKEYNKSAAFTDRKMTDTPTDALSVVNKKYVDDLVLGDLNDVTITSGAQGDILYKGASAYNNLAPGTSGYFLQTQGASANPIWAEVVSGITADYPADEAITAGNAVSLVPQSVEEQAYADTNQDADLAMGDNSARTYVAQGFVPDTTGAITAVDLYLKKSGTPTDNLVVEIWSKTGASPNQTPSAIFHADLTATLAGSDITASYVHYRIHFPELVSIASGTLYYVVIYRSGAIDASHYYVVGVDNSSAGYGGTDETRHVGDATPAWTETTTSDLIFKTYVASSTADAVRKSKANSTLLVNGFNGFATENIAIDVVGTIRRAGNVTGLTGLTPGALHYLSDTAGAISTTAGSRVAAALIANSATAGDIPMIQPPPLQNVRFGGQTTRVTAADNAVLQTLLTIPVPANTLGPNGALRITLYGKGYTGNTSAWEIKYGSQIFASETVPSENTIIFDTIIGNRNDTSVQVANSIKWEDAVAKPELGVTGTQDTTGLLNITVTYAAASTGGTPGYIEYMLVEVIR